MVFRRGKTGTGYCLSPRSGGASVAIIAPYSSPLRGTMQRQAMAAIRIITPGTPM